MIDSPWNLMPKSSPAVGQLNPASTRKQVEKAVAGFESVLLREWLRQVRSSPLTSESQTAGAGYLEMADDQLANFVSRTGGLGLTRQLADQLLTQIRGAELIGSADQAVNLKGSGEVAGE